LADEVEAGLQQNDLRPAYRAIKQTLCTQRKFSMPFCIFDDERSNAQRKFNDQICN